MTDEVLELEGVIADRLVRTMVWERALRSLDADVRRRIVARDPTVFGAWVRLSELLRSLHGELATEGMSFVDALECEFGPENVGERARWEALGTVQAAYRADLLELGLADPHDARWAALESGRIAWEGDVVLVGVADPNRIVREVVVALGERVRVLVFAPEEVRGDFDAIGGLVTEAWISRDVPVAVADWHVVDKPVDQAQKAMDVIAGLEGAFTAEEITIGVCDEEVAPFLDRLLLERGCRARHGRGTQAAGTAVARLMDATARYLERPRFPSLAVLLRHPDLEPVVSAACELGARDSAECLDAYYNHHLPDRVDGEWIRGAKRGAGDEVAALHESLGAVLGELKLRERRPLSEWTGPIRGYLETVYAGVELSSEVEAERVLMKALELVGKAIGEIESLQSELGGRDVLAHEALELVLSGFTSAMIAPAQPEKGRPTIELLGWLELPLDDAKAMVVTGWNEGCVPESVQGHPFLPEALREVLRLSTNEDRLARDAYAATLLATRTDVAFLSGRRSIEGEPRLPSRLAFHRPEGECVERAQHMLADSGRGRAAPSTEPLPPTVLPESSTPRIIETMRVTDFKAFMDSPYAYYLRRVLQVETTDDAARELDPMVFGSLVHHGLEKFGDDADLRDSTDERVIEEFLVAELEARVLERMGPQPLPAVAIQVEQIKMRYKHFARWQAERVKQGWRIRYAEWKPKGGHLLKVCGEKMRITGAIDRIDQHEEFGWAILDYKSGDKPYTPKDAHGPLAGWKDLQLPLYLHLATELELEGPVALGYIAIPRDMRSIGEFMAHWEDEALDAADEMAAEVIRGVRAGDWFVKGKVPRYDAITRALFGEGLLTGDASEDDEEGAA
jgi:hypothetical protein